MELVNCVIVVSLLAVALVVADVSSGNLRFLEGTAWK